MNSESYRVHVIVDPLYGERLCGLPSDEPVWVIGTDANRPVIERLWAKRKASAHTDGITSFKANEEDSPEAVLVGELPAIDLHHGECSHDPPYSVLNVVGANCSETLREALNEYGFSEYEHTTEGFTARKRPANKEVK